MQFNHKLIWAGAVSAIALFAAGSVTQAQDLNAQEKALIAGAKAEGAVVLINPLFSDRTSQRMGAAFKKRYGLGDDFEFNSLRKGTGATVSQVNQHLHTFVDDLMRLLTLDIGDNAYAASIVFLLGRIKSFFS